MSPIRFRDEEPSLGSVLASLAVGALAGFAVGVITAQKVGGISGIASRLRRRLAEYDEESEAYVRAHHEDYEEDELEDEEEEAEEAFGAEADIEERVLEAFEEDAVLGERAIEIGAIADGVIELSGLVESEAESRRAETVARRVPGVTSIVNRLSVSDEVERQSPPAEEAALGDAASAEDTSEPLEGGRWEGQRVGTGRRRQGTSDDPDRHADPKPELEDRWLDEQHAVREAAGDIEGLGERRRRRSRKPADEGVEGDRTEGGPISPSGVPKADHVQHPDEAPGT